MWISTSVDPKTQNVLFALQFSDVPNFYVVGNIMKSSWV